MFAAGCCRSSYGCCVGLGGPFCVLHFLGGSSHSQWGLLPLHNLQEMKQWVLVWRNGVAMNLVIMATLFFQRKAHTFAHKKPVNVLL